MKIKSRIEITKGKGRYKSDNFKARKESGEFPSSTKNKRTKRIVLRHQSKNDKFRMTLSQEKQGDGINYFFNKINTGMNSIRNKSSNSQAGNLR